MNFYFYSLVRYIPDLERCEPRNVGLIIHSPTKQEVMFRLKSTFHLFNEWNKWFEDELKEEGIDQDWFLEALSSKMTDYIRLSKPAILGLDLDLEKTFEEKFERLVL